MELSEAWRTCFVLRQVVVDGIPRRFRAHVNMPIRTRLWIVIEGAHGDDDDPARVIDPRHARPAHLAEPMPEVLRFWQSVLRHEVLSVEVAEARRRQEQVRCICSAPHLSAPAAVAVGDAARGTSHLEPDGAAETASFHGRHGPESTQARVVVEARTSSAARRRASRIDWERMLSDSRACRSCPPEPA